MGMALEDKRCDPQLSFVKINREKFAPGTKILNDGVGNIKLQ